MAKSSLSDMLSKLSLDSENEDRLTFYLSFLRRRGKMSFLFSKKACFIPDIETNKWIYLELRKIKNKFAWGCSNCENLKTFRNINESKDILDRYCIHAQVAFMLIEKDVLEEKYNDKTEELVEVMSGSHYVHKYCQEHCLQEH